METAVRKFARLRLSGMRTFPRSQGVFREALIAGLGEKLNDLNVKSDI